MSSFIAVVNAGSSSVKFGIYEATKEARCRFRGQVEGIGTAPRLKVVDAAGAGVAEQIFRGAGLRPWRGYARDPGNRARVA